MSEKFDKRTRAGRENVQTRSREARDTESFFLTQILVYYKRGIVGRFFAALSDQELELQAFDIARVAPVSTHQIFEVLTRLEVLKNGSGLTESKAEKGKLVPNGLDVAALNFLYKLGTYIKKIDKTSEDSFPGYVFPEDIKTFFGAYAAETEQMSIQGYLMLAFAYLLIEQQFRFQQATQEKSEAPPARKISFSELRPHLYRGKEKRKKDASSIFDIINKEKDTRFIQQPTPEQFDQITLAAIQRGLPAPSDQEFESFTFFSEELVKTICACKYFTEFERALQKKKISGINLQNYREFQEAVLAVLHASVGTSAPVNWM